MITEIFYFCETAYFYRGGLTMNIKPRYRGLRQLTWQSIRVRMIGGLLLVVMPLIGFLLYSNIYAIDVVRNQVASSNKDLLVLYRDQIDAKLKEADDYLIELMIGTDLNELDYALNPEERFFASQRVAANLSSSISRYSVLDGLYVYEPSSDNYYYSFQTRSTYEDRQYIRSHVYETLKAGASPLELNRKKWYVQNHNGQTYLIRLWKMKNGTTVGAWLNARSFQTPLELLSVGNKGAALLIDDRGKAMVNQTFIRDSGVEVQLNPQSYYLTGTSSRYLTVGEHSRLGEFSLYAFIPEETILQHLPTLKTISTLLPFGSVVILIIGLILLRKWLLVPINRLLRAMNRIQQGHVDTQIREYPTSIEFRVMNDTFNSMVGQIKSLRINIYEEQLNKQKAELQHLQLQIKPHFYINALNMIHTLARRNDVRRIEDMSLYMVRYFRYMFQSNLTFVSLKDEIQHIRNYLNIQELRFPSQIVHEIEVPDFLLRTPVPPLVIQTLVENAMKHAISLDEPVRVQVRVEMDESPERGLIIQIQDTGPGFKEGMIDKIAADERIIDEEGEHIGFWNLKQRLRLLYGNRAKVELRNVQPHGAMVELRLPFSPDGGTTV